MEFKLPDLGENIEAGEVINVLVAVGDVLSEDQPVIELETDKAVIEVPSSVTGTVTKVLVEQGDQAAVGQVILTVAVDGHQAETAAPEAAAPAPAAPVVSESATVAVTTAPTPEPASAPTPAAIEVTLPELGEGVDSGDIIAVAVAVGDRLAIDDPVIEIEIDKGVVEMPAPVAGEVSEIHVAVGQKATVGQLILTVQSEGGSAEVSPAPQATAAPPASVAPSAPAPAPVAIPATPAPAVPSGTDTPAPSRLVPAAPSVRRLAREIGIDIAEVAGSGPAGRISPEDVKAHSRALHSRPQAPALAAATAEPLPDFTKWGEIEREAMGNVRRITAQHMARAWSQIPHVTQFDKADISDLERWRKQFGKVAEAAGGKLTPTAIVLKVAAAALKRFPQFNASIDIAHEEVIYKKYIHIGVAVDTKRGLLVPVVRDVDQKNLVELAVELGEIAEKARTGKLGLADMQGGTFTISNLGGIGGTAFTPIVNAPEVAILGVARGSQEPVWVEGAFVLRLMMPLSLSYDHRLIDGADGARFLRWLCDALANPFLLALEG